MAFALYSAFHALVQSQRSLPSEPLELRLCTPSTHALLLRSQRMAQPVRLLVGQLGRLLVGQLLPAQLLVGWVPLALLHLVQLALLRRLLMLPLGLLLLTPLVVWPPGQLVGRLPLGRLPLGLLLTPLVVWRPGQLPLGQLLPCGDQSFFDTWRW